MKREYGITRQHPAWGTIWLKSPPNGNTTAWSVISREAMPLTKPRAQLLAGDLMELRGFAVKVQRIRS